MNTNEVKNHWNVSPNWSCDEDGEDYLDGSYEVSDYRDKTFIADSKENAEWIAKILNR